MIPTLIIGLADQSIYGRSSAQQSIYEGWLNPWGLWYRNYFSDLDVCMYVDSDEDVEN